MSYWNEVVLKIRCAVTRFVHLSIPVIACGFIMVLVSVALIFSTASARPSENPGMAPLQQDAAGGKAIFDEKCAGCHTIGKGKLVGPDLKDVTQRRDAQWLKSFIADPPKMLASDPVAQQMLKEYNNLIMPKMDLTDEQIDQLMAYLSNPGDVAAAPEPAPSVQGDPVLGERLFTGEQAFTNGAPACLACHTVLGAGSLGGGGLGPDLTHVFTRMGEAGISAALKTIVYPTMIGPFRNRPLTTDEQAALVAFFNEADRAQAPVAVTAAGAWNQHALLILGIGLLVTVLLFGLLLFFWLRIRRSTALRLPVRKV